MDRYLLTALTLSSWCVFYLVSLWVRKHQSNTAPESKTAERLKLLGFIAVALVSMTVVMGIFPETLIYYIILIILLGILTSLNSRTTIYKEIAYTGIICSLSVSLIGVFFHRSMM